MNRREVCKGVNGQVQARGYPSEIVIVIVIVGVNVEVGLIVLQTWGCVVEVRDWRN